MKTINSVKPTLTNPELYRLGAFDKGGRWYPCETVAEYFKTIRRPSRAWPLSYWKAAKTQKFYKWLESNNLLNLCV